ncbi:Na+ dependent nucleoside transporter C-terminus-domain-containing protein [Thamnidium elegans]|nr:Na+ dependent nucleoside transporter C-terminus-domain-containing protein [Thamnidium elegans]
MEQDSVTITINQKEGSIGSTESRSIEEGAIVHKPRTFYNIYRIYIHFLIWLGLTGFLCASYALQIPKGYNQELLVLGIIYLYITLYIIFCHVSTTLVTRPVVMTLNSVSSTLEKFLTPKKRSIIYGILVTLIIVSIVFSFPESQDSPRLKRLVSLFGMFVFIIMTFAASVHRQHVQWNTISTAILLQFLLALFVFRTSVGHDLFRWVSAFVETFLHNAYYGSEFVFGTTAANAGTFALNVFPALIFFASVVQMLYYLGTIQWVLSKVSVVFIYLLGISGAESVVAIASPFLGCCENPLLIQPLLRRLTKSEIHQIMTSGFATISGSVLYGYISMGVSGQALLTSCIMSIPCSVAISKLRYPETEISETKEKIQVHVDEETTNLLQAAGKGADIGIKISFLILANIISILAILYATNQFLTWLGNFVNINELTLQLITGYIFVPIAWLIGADNKDLVLVGRLMATKIWSNEFIAFQQLTNEYKGQLTLRSELVSTYALCGFANFGSVGMQVGVMGALTPTRLDDISQLAISALICGSLSTWLSAAVAGMLL